MFVTLIPKTSAGQEIVARHGSVWYVRQVADEVQFSEEPGPWLSVESPHDLRWVHRNYDSDFMVEPHGSTLSPSEAEDLRKTLTFVGLAESSDQPPETAMRATRAHSRRPKSPVLALVLSLIFGPFGYLYIGWRYAVMAIAVCVIFVLVIAFVQFPFPSWIKYIILAVLGWKGWTIVSVRNAVLIEDPEIAEKLDTFPLVAMAMSDLLVGIGMFYAAAIGLYIGVNLVIQGAALKGVLVIVLGTPALVCLTILGFGVIASAIDAIVAPQMRNLFRE